MTNIPLSRVSAMSRRQLERPSNHTVEIHPQNEGGPGRQRRRVRGPIGRPDRRSEHARRHPPTDAATACAVQCVSHSYELPRDCLRGALSAACPGTASAAHTRTVSCPGTASARTASWSGPASLQGVPAPGVPEEKQGNQQIGHSVSRVRSSPCSSSAPVLQHPLSLAATTDAQVQPDSSSSPSAHWLEASLASSCVSAVLSSSSRGGVCTVVLSAVRKRLSSTRRFCLAVG